MDSPTPCPKREKLTDHSYAAKFIQNISYQDCKMLIFASLKKQSPKIEFRQLLLHSLEKYSSKVAVEFVSLSNNQTTQSIVTFDELASHQRASSHFIRSTLGIEYEECGKDAQIRPRIVLLLSPSRWFLGILLGVLEACIYLPLDPYLPEFVLEKHLERIRPDMVIIESNKEQFLTSPFRIALLNLDTGALDLLPSASNTIVDPSPQTAVILSEDAHEEQKIELDILCGLTSSGTTGDPKLIYISAESLATNLESLVQLSMASGGDRVVDRIIQLAPFTFDPSLFELLVPVITGTTLVMPSLELRRDLKTHLKDFIGNCALLQMTPSLLRFIGRDAFTEVITSISVLMVGGEAFLTQQEAKDFFGDSTLKVLCLYGITEVSIWATSLLLDVKAWIEHSGTSIVPLGSTMNETHLKLVSSKEVELVLEELPIPAHPFYAEEEPKILPYRTEFENLECRLWIGSATRRCFLPPEQKPSFWRDTGDLVRLSRGYLYHIGRVDDVFKIMGKKVNTKDLETTIKKFPSITDCCVLPFPPSDPLCLIAAIASDHRTAPTLLADIHKYCLERLPELTRPADIIPLLYLPMTQHNKVDKQAIYRIFSGTSHLGSSSTREDVEQVVSAIWIKVLRLHASTVDPRDIFVLTGSSIDAAAFSALILNSIASSEARKMRVKLISTVFHGTFKDVVDYVHLLASDQYETIKNQGAREELHETKTEAPRHQVPSLPFKTILCANNQGLGYLPSSSLSQLALDPSQPRKDGNWSCSWRVEMNRCVDGGSAVALDRDDIAFIYAASHSGTIRCIDFETGAVVWTLELQERVVASLTLSPSGTLVVPCFGGIMALIDVATGLVKHWVECSSPEYDLKTTPVIVNETAIFSSSDGSLIQVALDSGICSKFTSASSSSPSLTNAALSKNTIVVCRKSGEVSAFSTSNLSSPVWHFEPSGAQTPIFASPTIVGDRVVVVNVTGTVRAWSLASGQLYWTFDISSLVLPASTPTLVFSSPVAIPGSKDDQRDPHQSDRVVIGCQNGTLLCLSAEDGSVQWHRPLHTRRRLLPQETDDDGMGSQPRIESKSQIFATPSLLILPSTSTLALCVPTTDGRIHLVSVKDGSELVDPYDGRAETFCAPVVFQAGKSGLFLLLGFRDDYLYCLRVESELM